MIDLTRLKERVENEVKNFNLEELDTVGLDRRLEPYYLIATYPPLAAMEEPRDGFVETALSNTRQPVDLYLHFPFCRVMGPYECIFCHFYKETHDPRQEDRYIRACMKEITMYRQRLGTVAVRSVYFGGGTFSLVSPANLGRLFQFLRDELDIGPDAEIKFEIHADAAKKPDLLEKLLDVLKEFRVTHIVIDIQTLNRESLRILSWDRVTPKHYFETLERCIEAGFQRIVTGLILGLPFESFESFTQGIVMLATIPQVKTVNIFPLMFRKGDFVNDQLKRTPEIFPDVPQRDIMHHGARILMDGFGFHESPIYFMNRQKTKPDQQTSKFEGNTLLAIGPSAFGMYRGDRAAQYYNIPNLTRYLETVERGDWPVWRVGPMSERGPFYRHIILGVLNMNQPLDMADLPPHVKSRVSPMLHFLQNKGLLEIENDRVSITPKGLLRAEEIAYYFAEEPVRRALKQPGRHGDIYRYNYFSTRSSRQEELFFASVKNRKHFF